MSKKNGANDLREMHARCIGLDHSQAARAGASGRVRRPGHAR